MECQLDTINSLLFIDPTPSGKLAARRRMPSIDERVNALVMARRSKYNQKKADYYWLKVIGLVLLVVVFIFAIAAICVSYSLEMAISRSCALYSVENECIENDYIGAAWFRLKDNSSLNLYLCSNAIFFRTWSPASTGVKVHLHLPTDEEKMFSLKSEGNGYWSTKTCLDEQDIRYYYEYSKGDATALLPDLNSPQLHIVNSTTTQEVDHLETVLMNEIYQFNYDEHVVLNPAARNIFYMLDLQSYMGEEEETGYYVAYYESEYFNTLGITGMILGNAEMRFCNEENCWAYPALHPGAFNPDHGTIASLKSAVDRIHKRGVAVLLEVRWDFFTSLTPIAMYQAFNEEVTDDHSKLASFVVPPPTNGNSTSSPRPTCRQYHENDNSNGGGGSKQYCVAHDEYVHTSQHQPHYTLNLRKGSPARTLIRQYFQRLYHDLHIDGLYWSEAECDSGIGSDGCLDGKSTDEEKEWMKELMREAKEIGLVQISAIPGLDESDYTVDYSLYHYVMDTYANTNTTVDVPALVAFMNSLPENHVWAMEGPYTASNRLINQLNGDQYTIYKTMMMFFSRNLFLFMGSDFDYPVNYVSPYHPLDYYNLIGLYYNNNNPGWTGGRNYTDSLNQMQQARKFMIDNHFYEKVLSAPLSSAADPLAGSHSFVLCKDGLFVMLRSRGTEQFLMVFNNKRESRDMQFAIPYSHYFDPSSGNYSLQTRFHVVYDEVRSLLPKLLGIGCDGVTEIDTRWFFDPNPEDMHMPTLGPTMGLTVADHLCYLVSLKRFEYSFYIPTEVTVVKKEEMNY